MGGTRARLGLVFGLILGSHAQAGAQSPERGITFVESPTSPPQTFTPGNAVPLAFSVLLIQQPGNIHEGQGLRITRNYRDQNPVSISPVQETKTSFATESLLPFAQIWGARMRVSLFNVTVKTGNIMLGPLASNEALHRLRRPGDPRSADLYGIGVSVPVGRAARWENSTLPWRRLLRMVRCE
jgi:hypothetical protein